MRLRRVRVQNFRSIVDSGIVDIDNRVTVLIGKNEQGKTTFQKALASLNEGVRYTPKDLPNHLRASLEKKPSDQIPILDAWFSVDPAEITRLSTSISELSSFVGLHVTKYYDGHCAYAGVAGDETETPVSSRPASITSFVNDIHMYLTGLEEKLKAHGERLTSFAPTLEQAQTHIGALSAARLEDHDQLPNLVKTFSTAMMALPGQDEAIQEDIAQATASIAKAQTNIQQAVSRDYFQPLREAMPRLIFHSTTMDKVPDFVPIVDFVASPETSSKGMANLCAVAGLSGQKIQQLATISDAAEREIFEDHYRGTISGGVNEFWTQEKYNVHFRIEAARMSVSISDDTYTQRIPPSDRSDGFQWYLSFYAALLSEVSATDAMVLLLDNPALELHADGQRDIKRFLELKLPAPAQVIYVTHSSAMIDVFNLEQVRQVELLGEFQGTKVSKLKIKEGTDFDLLEPVRSAIGATLAASLILNEFNVLAEGAADKPILEGAFSSLRPDATSRLLINGSISESSGLLPRFYLRAKLPLVTFLDADSSARRLREKLLEWGIPQDQIVDLRALFDNRGDDFELEDILSRDFYHAAVAEAYPDQAVDQPPDGYVGKRTKYYERTFRDVHQVGFVKRRVAEAAKRLLQQQRADDDTRTNLRRVIDAIWDALQRQIPNAQNAAGT